MVKYLDGTGLGYFWGKIKALFATKDELSAKPTARIYYGTCSTAAKTYAKTATVETFPTVTETVDNVEVTKPMTGIVIGVKYANSNSYETAGQTHTLNVNNTGDFPLYYNNAELVSTTSANTLVAGYANRYVFYMFNGAQWVWLSASYDTNSTYSAMTQAEIDAGTGTTGRTMTPKLLRDNFYTEGEVDTLLAAKAATATTLAGYGITDAKIESGVITLGSDTITPLTSYTETDPVFSASAAAGITSSDITNWNGKTSNTGTITSVKMNGSTISSSGEADLGTVITSHQDISGKANASEMSVSTSGDQTTITLKSGTSATVINSHQSLTNYVQKSNTAGLLKNDGTVDTSTYLTSYTETDPTVPSWAKAANKPSYTAAEVGALPDTTTIPTASTATPQMDGTGAAGSASTYAKGDHVHPSDTSREARVTTVNHGTSDTTFALTPNVLHTWGTVSSLNLTLGSGSSTYVDGYWFKFTAGSSFTVLTLPTGVVWAAEPEIEEGKTYEVFIVNNLATYITEGIESMYATKAWVQSNTQAPLVSGTNIKTINGTSILGEGNISVSGGSSGGDTNIIEIVKVNGTALTPDANKAVDISVPSAVTENTVSGWGFTKNTGNVSSTDVTTIVLISESNYTNLSTKDSSTLYLIPSSS